MGGIGSGRPSGWGRDTVEQSRSLDVNRLYQTGCLRAGWTGSWQWTLDGQSVAVINVRAEPNRLYLSYRVRIAGGEWEHVKEPVGLVYVPCHFGGMRPYFLCPGVVQGVPCGRRVVKLYGAGRYFLCRYCYRLAHASQRERPWDRLLRRTIMIRHRLGGEPGMGALFPKKPKGMWWRTYERLCGVCLDGEGRAEEAFLLRTAHRLTQIETRHLSRRG